MAPLTDNSPRWSSGWATEIMITNNSLLCAFCILSKTVVFSVFDLFRYVLIFEAATIKLTAKQQPQQQQCSCNTSCQICPRYPLLCGFSGRRKSKYIQQRWMKNLFEYHFEFTHICIFYNYHCCFIRKYFTKHNNRI